jgi:hypothetical protein
MVVVFRWREGEAFLVCPQLFRANAVAFDQFLCLLFLFVWASQLLGMTWVSPVAVLSVGLVLVLSLADL